MESRPLGGLLNDIVVMKESDRSGEDGVVGTCIRRRSGVAMPLLLSEERPEQEERNKKSSIDIVMPL